MLLTTEELRIAALDASNRRGWWVARRRIFMRWFGWIMWHIVLPGVGVLSLLAAFFVFASWHYLGANTALYTAQNWLQKLQSGYVQSDMFQKHQSDLVLPVQTDLMPIAEPHLQMDNNYLNLKPKNNSYETAPPTSQSATGKPP